MPSSPPSILLAPRATSRRDPPPQRGRSAHCRCGAGLGWPARIARRSASRRLSFVPVTPASVSFRCVPSAFRSSSTRWDRPVREVRVRPGPVRRRLVVPVEDQPRRRVDPARGPANGRNPTSRSRRRPRSATRDRCPEASVGDGRWRKRDVAIVGINQLKRTRPDSSTGRNAAPR